MDEQKISGTEALQALLDGMPEGPAWNRGRPVNIWEAATEAARAANEETVRAALGRLLALHLDELQTRYPIVAFRNIKNRDVLLLDGVKHWVVDHPERRGQDGETVYIKARPTHLPLAKAQTFAYGRNARVELVYRPPASAELSIHADVSVSEMVRRVIDSEALPSDFKIFNDYGRQTIPGLNTRTLNRLYTLFSEKLWKPFAETSETGEPKEINETTLSDLLEVSDEDLWKIRNFGEGCMKNLKDSLGSLIRDKEIG